MARTIPATVLASMVADIGGATNAMARLASIAPRVASAIELVMTIPKEARTHLPPWPVEDEGNWNDTLSHEGSKICIPIGNLSSP